MYGNVWKFLFERFLDRDRDVPRVAVSLKPGETRLDPEGSGTETKIPVRWSFRIVLTNESSAAAADLKLVWPSAQVPFQVTLPYHLDPFVEKAVPVRGETIMDRKAVEGSSGDQLFALLLQELGATSLVVTYRDTRGDHFHTRYSRSAGQESVEFLKKLPDS